MSKIITFLLIIFIFHLLPIFPKALATQACNTMGITYSSDAFSANPSSLNFDFKISGENRIKNLMGKEVRLRITQRFWSDYQTASKTINSDSFSLTAGPGGYYRVDPLSPGTHTAVLDWRPNPITPGVPVANEGYEELCSRIVYTVGDPKTCVIDPTLPSRIPPDTKLTIKFSGKPNDDYTLFLPGGLTDQFLAKTITDNSGQGDFKNVNIPGGSGNTVDLRVGDYIGGDKRYSKPYCSKQITIDFNAPQPGPPGTGPVPTAGPGTAPGPGGETKKPQGPPTAAGGEIKKGCTDKGGVSTAIGCIHTSPAEFAKDILKFAIGIGGGLAFLMMLLGAFQMLTSQGNPEILKAGQDRLTSAVIGLLFVIFAVLFLQIIGANILGLPDFKP